MASRPRSRAWAMGLAGWLFLLGGACGLWPWPRGQPTPTVQPHPTEARGMAMPRGSPSPPPTTARPATPTASPQPPTATPTPTVAATPPANWARIAPLPEGPIRLTQLHMVDAQQGWAVGSRPDAPVPRILITDDGARTWREVTPPVLPPAAEIREVQALFWDRDTAWVAYGYETSTLAVPGVWVTHDRGQTWSWAPIPWTEDMAMPWFNPGPWYALDAQRAWLVVHLDAGMGHDYILLAASTDGGHSWQVVADPFADAAADLMIMFTSGLAFAADGQYGWATKDAGPLPAALVVVTEDGGRSWQARPFSPWGDDRAFCSTRDPHLWGRGQGVVLVLCLTDDSNGGQRVFVAYWQHDAPQAVVPIDAPLAWEASLAFPAPGEGYLAVYPRGDEGMDDPPYRTYLFVSADDGRSWRLARELNWRGIFSWREGGEGWALADNGREVRVVHTTDRGRHWELLPEPRVITP